jgi:hypothetical protein
MKKEKNPLIEIVLGISFIALGIVGVLLPVLYRGHPIYIYTGLGFIILGTYAVYDGTRLFLAKRAENSSQSIANEDLWEDWRKRRVNSKSKCCLTT